MAEQPAVQQPTKSSSFVTVGCKMPNGLHLDITEHGKPIHRYTVKGSNAKDAVAGFGITENVPEEFFEEWMRRNKGLPVVRNGLVFAMPKRASVEDKAKESAKLRHGLEPLDPKTPAKGIDPLKAE